MKVRHLRKQIQALAANGEKDAHVNALLMILADFDDMDIEAFFRKLRKKEPKQTGAPTQPRPPLDAKMMASKLRSVWADDITFENTLAEITRPKIVTKATLTTVYYDLFNRTDGIPAKITRGDLIRLIEDERTIAVRNEKMGKLLGRRVVPAG